MSLNLWPDIWSILRMYRVHLRRTCILLSRVFCICLLYLVGLCFVQLRFPTLLLSACSIYYLEWDIGISSCYLELLICPFNSVSFGFRYFDLLRGVNLYNYASFCYVEPLLIYWYIISFVLETFFDLWSIMFDSH